MKRSEVWWVDFDPSIGGETQKIRPAVIISNNSSNQYLNRVQVVPLTSNTGKCYPSEAMVTINAEQSKAMADQIATVDKRRLKSLLGLLSAKDMKAVEKAVKIQLGFPL